MIIVVKVKMLYLILIGRSFVDRGVYRLPLSCLFKEGTKSFISRELSWTK